MVQWSFTSPHPPKRPDSIVLFILVSLIFIFNMNAYVEVLNHIIKN